MRAFLWNIFLAMLWASLAGQLTVFNLAVGFALGALVLSFVRREGGSERYFVKLRQAVGLAAFFLWELLLSNLRVAYDVVTPHHYMRPGIVAVPLDAETDAEITLLANLLTLTPGTLSLDVSADRRFLYVHMMYIEDADVARRQIKDGYERRVLEVLR
ncbi:MAG: Na+/H+ antiporter subunit E [Planctomycetaceae bacterium]|nr:Na+/H+ antiporter subunit E [Planctomycetaceae bacterium]